MIDLLKKLLRKNEQIKNISEELHHKLTFNYEMGEILPLLPRKSSNKSKRINLLVPSINQKHIFGGIATALKFYSKLADYLQWEKRIITLDASPSKDDLGYFEDYKLVLANECDCNICNQIMPFNDRYEKDFPLRENDFFVCTAWWTAYLVQDLLRWQAQNYSQKVKRMIYFIQDYEPGFYAWSSRYGLAESTYKSKLPQIAIFNSKLLYDYFQDQGYNFIQRHYFQPRLNEQLKKFLFSIGDKDLKKKKQIIFYGRPSVERNAFALGIESLKRWSEKFPGADKWTIFSIGEKHPNINLKNNCQVISLGKLTLTEYATLMLESYIGISLMISPHPSYPPLEMSIYGVKVFTNIYANKNLENFNSNIFNFYTLEPEIMAKQLQELSKAYNESNFKIFKDHPYVKETIDFSFIEDIDLGAES